MADRGEHLRPRQYQLHRPPRDPRGQGRERLPIERVRVGLGDSAMPRAPQEGGSGLTGALGNAVHATCVGLIRAFVNLVHDDEASPPQGCRLEGIVD
jgi:hypothetical protein